MQRVMPLPWAGASLFLRRYLRHFTVRASDVCCVTAPAVADIVTVDVPAGVTVDAVVPPVEEL